MSPDFLVLLSVLVVPGILVLHLIQAGLDYQQDQVNQMLLDLLVVQVDL